MSIFLEISKRSLPGLNALKIKAVEATTSADKAIVIFRLRVIVSIIFRERDRVRDHPRGDTFPGV